MMVVTELRQMFGQSGTNKWFNLSVLLTVMWLPISSKGIGIPISLMIISWLFSPKKITKEKGLAILLFASIYLFHLIAMIYTDDVARGIRDLGQKASLIIFPILFGTLPSSSLPKRSLVFGVFVMGLIASVFLSFSESIIKYSQSGLISDFFMSEFSYSHHPSYLALFLNMGLAVILMDVINSIRKPSLHFVKGIISIVLISGIIYSASKMGFIQFVFLIGFILVYWVAKKSLNQNNTSLITIVALLFGILFYSNPIAKNRIFYTVELMENQEVATAENQTESTVARLTTWEITLDEISKAPFGVGTGDIQDVLDERYMEEGYDLLAEKGLNPHNVFLQIGLAQGIPAMVVFAFSLIFPFGRILRKKDWLYAFFLLSILMHFMVESMLEKQSGVVFFAFFNAYLFFGDE